MFEMFNILFIVYYYLFVMFKFLFVENYYLFLFLKYLFGVAKTNYLLFKKIVFRKYYVNIGKCGLVLKI